MSGRLKARIEIDGGIDLNNIGEVVAAAPKFWWGSAISVRLTAGSNALDARSDSRVVYDCRLAIPRAIADGFSGKIGLK